MINHHRSSQQADLTLAIQDLRDEVRVLRDVLDEIRDALQWHNKNDAEDICSSSEPSGPQLAFDGHLPPVPRGTANGTESMNPPSHAFARTHLLFDR